MEINGYLAVVDYVFVAIHACVAVAIVISNCLVIASFCKFEYVRTVDNCYLLSLSIADLLTGPCLVLANVLSVFYVDSPPLGPLCIMAGGISGLAFLCQIWSIQLLTIDRWMCVHYPMRAPRPITDMVAKKLLSAMWVSAVVVVLHLMLFNEWKPGVECYTFNILNSLGLKYIAAPLTLIPLLVMPLLYAMMCRTAFKHARQIRDQQYALADPTLSMRTHHLKTMKTLTLILGFLYLAWVPRIISFVLINMKAAPADPTVVKHIFNNLTVTAMYCWSFLDPLIYHRSCPNFRKALRLILFPVSSREYYRQMALREMMTSHQALSHIEPGGHESTDTPLSNSRPHDGNHGSVN